MAWRWLRRLLSSAGMVGAALVAFTGSVAPAQAAAPVSLSSTTIVRFINQDGKCLDMPNNSLRRGTQAQIWTCNDNPQQNWDVSHCFSDHTCLIVNPNTERTPPTPDGPQCLSIAGNDNNPGGAVIQYNCNFSGGDVYERWFASAPLPGPFQIVNDATGLVMHPSGCQAANGTKIFVNLPDQCLADFWTEG